MPSVSCTKCSKSFQSVSSRNRHLRDIHSDSSAICSRSRIICPLCHMCHSSFNLLMDHLDKIHSIKCKSEDISFTTKADFEKWKEHTEKESKSFYALTSTAGKTSGRTLYYECHRSNLSKFHSSCKVRAPKIGNSIKINGVCPSRIRAEIDSNTGEVTINFTMTHVGHKEELHCQPLSKTEKNLITEQLKLGLSSETILKKAKYDEYSRLSLLTMKDIHNIAQKNHLKQKVCTKSSKVSRASEDDMEPKIDTQISVKDEEISIKDEEIFVEDEEISGISEASSKQEKCQILFESVLASCSNDENYTYVAKNLLEMKEHLGKLNLP